MERNHVPLELVILETLCTRYSFYSTSVQGTGLAYASTGTIVTLICTRSLSRSFGTASKKKDIERMTRYSLSSRIYASIIIAI